MDLSIYDVIKGPVVTDKAHFLNKNKQKLVIEVHPDSNKPMIAGALRKLFNVEVESVRIIVRKGKTKFVKRMEVKGKISKRAIITLKDGYSIDGFDQQAGVVATSESGNNETRQQLLQE